MAPSAKLAAFLLALALAFGGGAALGAAVGPIDDDEPAPAHTGWDGGHDRDGHEGTP